jgi:hypothetical protein
MLRQRIAAKVDRRLCHGPKKKPTAQYLEGPQYQRLWILQPFIKSHNNTVNKMLFSTGPTGAQGARGGTGATGPMGPTNGTSNVTANRIATNVLQISSANSITASPSGKKCLLRQGTHQIPSSTFSSFVAVNATGQRTRIITSSSSTIVIDDVFTTGLVSDNLGDCVTLTLGEDGTLCFATSVSGFDAV